MGDIMEVSVFEVVSDAKVIAAVLIQFLLGLGLGYVSVKALKYIIAFIALLVLGSFLSVWSLGGSVDATLGYLGTLASSVKNLLFVLGLITVGPVSVGFIVGALIALLRK
ncbi:MAG: hypothetical protein QW154_00660 [Sulfolobales archaeon]